MITDKIYQDVAQAGKPLKKLLRKGKEFQILATGFKDHTTFAVNLQGEQFLHLRKGEDLDLMAISFQQDMVLEEQVSAVPAKLIVLEGGVIYSNALNSVTLELHDEYEIPIGETYWVEAMEDSLVLIIQG